MRRRVGPTITNFLAVGDSMASDPPISLAPKISTPLLSQVESEEIRSWYWEGNVQAAVVAFLVRGGWSIRRVVDTASREAGKDIEAERNDGALWVTVKGYPEATPRTTPYTQARHWFAGALFDVILWRQESLSAGIAVALPKRSTYQNLAARTTWFQEAAHCYYLWVTEDGVEGE